MQAYELLIDATSDDTFLYLIKNNEKIIDFKHFKNKQDLSTNLVKYIDKILTRNLINVNKLNSIYLVYGPGKFSAMRICATVAKTFKLLNQIPLKIIDKFDYLAEPNSLVVIKSDGHKSFTCSYDSNQLKADDVRLVEDQYLENIRQQFNNQTIIDDQSDYYKNFEKILHKLKDFQEVDENFNLIYFKPPC